MYLGFVNAAQEQLPCAHIITYRVSIGLREDEVNTACCSCSDDFEEWCQHIVATLLFCLRQQEAIEQRQSLEQILNRLNKAQTQILIQKLVAVKPELLDNIENFVDLNI